MTVSDTTRPVLNLPADKTLDATVPNGAEFNYNASASDLVDGSVPVDCRPSGNTFPLGTTTVDCSAKDKSGNEVAGSFKVTVKDTGAPRLNLPADMTVYATGNSAANVNYSVSASDLIDGNVAVQCSPGPGSFKVGTTTVACSAADKANNVANGSFKVNVIYKYSGFFQPIDNKDASGNYILNKAKAGSTIPVKFSLGGDQGMSVLEAGSPSSAALGCSSSSSTDAIEEYTNATSGLKYDPVANQYIYNWKSKSDWAGSCRQLVVKLADGTTQRASFHFVK